MISDREFNTMVKFATGFVFLVMGVFGIVLQFSILDQLPPETDLSGLMAACLGSIIMGVLVMVFNFRRMRE